jgi:hypothetical protein
MDEEVAAPRLCKDCRFAEIPLGAPEDDWDWAVCTHPTSIYQKPQNLVTGKVYAPHQMECSHARLNQGKDICGSDGRHWQPR